jgi:hypothetical protein
MSLSKKDGLLLVDGGFDLDEIVSQTLAKRQSTLCEVAGNSTSKLIATA